jgi:hypothetical protein
VSSTAVKEQHCDSVMLAVIVWLNLLVRKQRKFVGGLEIEKYETVACALATSAPTHLVDVAAKPMGKVVIVG